MVKSIVLWNFMATFQFLSNLIDIGYLLRKETVVTLSSHDTTLIEKRGKKERDWTYNCVQYFVFRLNDFLGTTE